MSYELSEYQKSIMSYVDNPLNGNLLVNAKAGSGKTSTLVLLADKLVKELGKNCLFLAFNDSIVTELKSKISYDECMVCTTYSMGLSFIRSELFKRYRSNYKINVTNDIEHNNVKKYFTEICGESFTAATKDLDPIQRHDLLNDIYQELYDLVVDCKLYCINLNNTSDIRDLVFKKGYEELVDYNIYGIKEFPKIIQMVIRETLENYENPDLKCDGYEINLTFTDMIYLPVYYRLTPAVKIRNHLDCVMVDECQDLSLLQQKLLKLLDVFKQGIKYIFVGDEHQSIYGFAGADTHSIENLKKNYSLTELPLDICYRCPKNVIALAREYVPEIKWNKARDDDGVVKILSPDELLYKLQPRRCSIRKEK